MKSLIKQYWPGLVGALLIAVAGWMIYLKLHPKTLPPNLIQGVGRIDGDLVNLGSQYPGRLVKVTVEDGQKITENDRVAQIDSKEYEARLAAAKAQLKAREMEYKAQSTAYAVAQKTVPLDLNRTRAQLRKIRADRTMLARRIDSLESLVEQDRRDFGRIRNLYDKRLIQKEQLEKMALKLKTDRNRLAAAKKKMVLVDASYQAAMADYMAAKAHQESLKAQKASLEALAAGVEAAKAQVDEIEAILDDLTIRSPLSGFVVEKIAYPGEVLAAGMPVATLIDPHSLYLKIFVDTIQNGKIKIGDKAVIFLDAAPDRAIPAKVVRIARQAEFTPKEVNVRSDRIQRVFAVHLKPLNLDPTLKLGLPAIGVVSLDGKGLPKSLRDLPQL